MGWVAPGEPGAAPLVATGLAFRPDGAELALIGEDATVRLVSATDWQPGGPLRLFRSHGLFYSEIGLGLFLF